MTMKRPEDSLSEDATRDAGSMVHSARAALPGFVGVLVVLLLGTVVPLHADDDRFESQKREMVDRGLQYLVSIQKDGAVGDARQKAVTALHILACLSSGVQPSHPAYGRSVQAAYEWILANSAKSFLGGAEDPNADHVLVLTALSELVGTAPNIKTNLVFYEKARTAMQYSLEIQDEGADPKYTGGWKPDDRTRVNDRMLTAWFLWQLYAGQLLNEKVSKSSIERAVEFVEASQKDAAAEKEDERGGFSISAAGLPVRSATAAGMAVMALLDPDKTKVDLARSWFARHPPNLRYAHCTAQENWMAARHTATTSSGWLACCASGNSPTAVFLSRRARGARLWRWAPATARPSASSFSTWTAASCPWTSEARRLRPAGQRR